MNVNLAVRAARRGGWFKRMDAISAGYTDREIGRLVRDGEWVRLCHGAYAAPGPEDAERSVWAQAIRRHVLTTSAIYHRTGGRAIVSHQSAALQHGIQVSDLDLSRVHLTQVAEHPRAGQPRAGHPRAGHGRTGREVCLHVAQPPVLDPEQLNGLQVTSAPRAVVETIRRTSYAVAVSVVDEALRRRIATADQLAAAVELFAGHSGVRTAAKAVAFGDGLSESVGESRLRVLLADLGLPQPALQVEIRTPAGRLVARVDFLLEQWGVVIEFDGALKYAGSGAEVLIAEKAREDDIRDLGYEVVRVTWADLSRPAEVLARIQRAIARSQRRLTA